LSKHRKTDFDPVGGGDTFWAEDNLRIRDRLKEEATQKHTKDRHLSVQQAKGVQEQGVKERLKNKGKRLRSDCCKTRERIIVRQNSPQHQSPPVGSVSSLAR